LRDRLAAQYRNLPTGLNTLATTERRGLPIQASIQKDSLNLDSSYFQKLYFNLKKLKCVEAAIAVGMNGGDRRLLSE
jgi:hypothetical protein